MRAELRPLSRPGSKRRSPSGFLTTAARSLLLICSTLGSISCGGATGALIAFLSSGKPSAGGASPGLVSDVRPVASSLGFKTSPLSFAFRLTDSESSPAEVEVLYTLPGAAGPVPVLLSGDTNLSGLSTSPGGVEHQRLWDFAGQLPGGGALVAGVELVVRLTDGSSVSSSQPFALGNDPPQAAVVATPAGEVTAVAAVDLTLSDSSGDLVTVLVEYQDLDASTGFHPATPLGGSLDAITAAPAGTAVRFLWDVTADEPGREFRAKLRFTPADPASTGTAVESGVITIDNNSEPLILVNGSSFFANPDQRRGIPIPFTVLDDEGDAVQVVFQWRLSGEPFPALPEDPAELALVLGSASERRARQIATEIPPAFEGNVVPAGSSSVRLLELGGSASRITTEFAVGREIEILRVPSPPASIVTDWSGAPPSLPVAALPFEDGDTVLLLDSPAAQSWRLREVHLSTGAVTRTVASGSNGDPSAMTYQPSQDAVLLGVDAAGVWKVIRVDLTSGAATVLITASGSTALGRIRSVAAPSGETALVTVGSSLVKVDFTSAGSPTEAAVLSGLQGPWGLALDAQRPHRLYLAERDWVNPSTSAVEGRVLNIDLRTLVRTQVATTGLSLFRPSSIALERQGTRLLALTDSNPADGTLELRAANIGGGLSGQAFEIGSGYPDDSCALATGPDLLRVLCMPAENDLAVGGGLEQVRTIASLITGSHQVTVSTPFDPPLSPLERWRIVDRSATIPAGPSTRGDVFVWDSRDLVESGKVVLRAFAFDTERGVSTDTGVPRAVQAGIDVTPQTIGGAGSTDGVSGLAVADLDGDGRLDLVSANTGGDSLSVFFQTASGSFGAAPDVTIQGIPVVAPMVQPVAVAILDADRDGDLDLVSANRGSNNLVLALQTTPRSFAVNPPALGGLSAPSEVVAGDLNGDGRPDLVCASTGGNKVAVFFQNALGLYNTTPSLVLGDGTTLGPRSVALGDLEGDGDIDIVGANQTTSNLAVFLQAAPGSFPAAPSFTLGGPAQTKSPLAVVVADLNGDGALDIGSANQSGNNLSLFFQGSGGVFPSAPSVLLAGHAGPTQPAHLAVGDLNGDGDPDLLTVTGNNLLNAFLFVPGLGRFSLEPLVLGEGDLNGPVRVVVEDLNGDGLNDMAIANSSGNSISVFVQDATGNFSGVQPSLVLGSALDTPGAAAVAAGDVDGDGSLDLVTANPGNGTLGVFPQFGAGTFDATPGKVLGDASTDGAGSVDTADLNGDGRVDVVSANGSAGSLTLFFQGSDGVLQTSPDLVLGSGTLSDPVSVRAADLDGDGDLDLACADAGTNTVLVFLQGSAGVFGSAPDLVLGGAGSTSGPTMVYCADLNGDGRTDLLCANGTGNSIAAFLQNGSGSFSGTPSFTLGGPGKTTSPRSVAAADLDGDGSLDVVSADSGGDDLAVFFAAAPGSIPLNPSLHLTGASLQGPTTVAIADLDQDGSNDVICGNSGSKNLTLFFQGRPRVFLPAKAFGGAGFTDSPASMVVADLDGDGDPDVISAEPALDNTSVFFGGR
jgi:hypothetical protein